MGTWGLIAYLVHVATEPADTGARLAAAATQTRTARAGALLMWAAIVAENVGDVAAARGYAERALALGPLPPYLTASLHAELSQLAMAVGEHHRAAEHAEVAWPLLARVHSQTDSYSLRMATAISPLIDGDLDRAEAMLEAFGEPDGETAQMGARLTWQTAQAELALARGHHADAIRRYDAIVEMVSESDPEAGINPWLMVSASAALVARARHGTPGADPRSVRLRDTVVGSGDGQPAGSLWFADLPLNGVMLVALSAWILRFGASDLHEDGVRLLAIAHRWSYNRSIPVMAWDPMVELAEAAVPGRIGALVEELAVRSGPDLQPDAVEVVDRLRDAWLTSS